MPTRLIREGILSSDKVDKLSAQAEVFYRRLMSKVDDHGLYDARLSLLRSGLYPLRIDTMTEDNCAQLLTDCINAKLILLYQVDNKPYLKMLNTQWKERSKPKYPTPDNNCKLVKTPVSLVVVVDVVRSRLIEVVDVVVSSGMEKPVDKSPNVNVQTIEKDLPSQTSTIAGNLASALRHNNHEDSDPVEVEKRRRIAELAGMGHNEEAAAVRATLKSH